MAIIRVKNLLTGQTGSLPEENFNPSKYQIVGPSQNESPQTNNVTPEEKRPLGGILPAVGGVLGAGIPSLTGFGIPLAAGGAALGTGAGYAMENVIQDLLGTQKQAPEEQLKEFGVRAGTAGATDLLLGGAGKLLGEVGGKVAPMLKGIMPKQLVSSLNTAKTTVSEAIDDLLNKSTAKIQIAPIVEKLNGLKSTYIERGNEKAVASVDNVIKFLSKQGDEISPAKANSLKIGFGEDIFGQAGKEVLKRGGSGIAEKSAKKIAGGELSDAITSTVDGAEDLFSQYGKIAETARSMNRPFQGWWKGSVAGMLLQPFGMASVPVTAGITALSMPYTRLLVQKLLGGTGKTLTSPITRSFAQAGLNQFINPSKTP